MSNVIINGSDRFSKEWLKSVTEKQAIQSLRANYEVNTIVKVWKIANGKSVPDYIKKAQEVSEKPKRTRKKKEDSSED